MLKFLSKIDFSLLLPALLLSSIGLLMIFSISFESDPSYFVRQLFYVAFSVVLYIVISKIEFKNLSHVSYILYFGLLVLLLATFFIGIEIRGSVRWLDLGLATLQGSEIAKPVLILGLAHLLAVNRDSPLKGFLLSGVLTAVPVIIIASQPDLSTAVILFLTWFFMVFVSGMSFIYISVFTLVALASVPIFWNLVLKDYQKTRILTFFNPEFDPLGASYNIVQALIALGSGQLFGRGLGRGTQSHLNFLPEERTDFIFAATGEELGFLGLSLILIIFSFLIFTLLKKAKNATNTESSIFLYGTSFLLAIQFFINAGMNMGIFPVSGVTLPFISFGGSSIVSLFALLAFAASASKKGEKLKD